MANEQALPEVAAPRATVLLVEDEVLIRMAAGEHLRDAGFLVIEAANADEALEVAASAVCIDVLLTDVRMPGSRDGLALAGELKMRYPALTIFVTSGHVEAGVGASVSHRFLRKPYDLDQLVELMRAAVSAQARR